MKIKNSCLKQLNSDKLLALSSISRKKTPQKYKTDKTNKKYEIQ